jgi:hypothetical protein
MWLLTNKDIVTTMTLDAAQKMLCKDNPFLEKFSVRSFNTCAKTIGIKFKRPPQLTRPVSPGRPSHDNLAFLSKTIIQVITATERAIGGNIDIPKDTFDRVQAIILRAESKSESN